MTKDVLMNYGFEISQKSKEYGILKKGLLELERTIKEYRKDTFKEKINNQVIFFTPLSFSLKPQTTPLNIEPSSIQVGYESVGQFSREFKRYFGEPPKDFARR
ncbi:MAG: helix-turn-helix domain-containing protein [SAR324 cluster bacterium]|nr:helix-turn-helix domain-containing protein [SAR324 cluster bacterium]